MRLRDSNALYSKLSIADLIKVVKEECALWGPMLDNQDTTEEEFQNKINEWSVGHSKAPILQGLFEYKESALAKSRAKSALLIAARAERAKALEDLKIAETARLLAINQAHVLPDVENESAVEKAIRLLSANMLTLTSQMTSQSIAAPVSSTPRAIKIDKIDFFGGNNKDKQNVMEWLRCIHTNMNYFKVPDESLVACARAHLNDQAARAVDDWINNP